MKMIISASGRLKGIWGRAWGEEARRMVHKASNRSAVHGAKLPVTETIVNEDERKEEIQKGKEKKEAQRKEVEKSVDSAVEPARET